MYNLKKRIKKLDFPFKLETQRIWAVWCWITDLLQFGLIKAKRSQRRGWAFTVLLLAAVMGSDHHVAVRWDVQRRRLRFVPTEPDLRPAAAAAGRSPSSSSARVVFVQVTDEGFPAAADTHHHMALVQHLQRRRQWRRIVLVFIFVTTSLWLILFY